MIKKNTLWKKLKINRGYQVTLFFLLMIVLFVGYFCANRKLHRTVEIKEQTFSWVYQVDEMKEENGKLIITGWAFELGQDATGNNYEIVLKDTETEKLYFPKMAYENREDVNDYFLCEYDYTQSGFTAVISIKKLDLDDAVYEVMLRPKEEKNAYSINVYYADNKMQFINSEEFIVPEVEGTDLEQIVNEGYIRAYSLEHNCYVYQLDGYFYFIADKDSSVFGRGNDYVDYMLSTTQTDNLPESRKEAGYTGDNKDFYFSSCEIEGNYGNYRVAKLDIPTAYSVTKILFGYRNNGWIWNSNFYIYYDFDK